MNRKKILQEYQRFLFNKIRNLDFMTEEDIATLTLTRSVLSKIEEYDIAISKPILKHILFNHIMMMIYIHSTGNRKIFRDFQYFKGSEFAEEMLSYLRAYDNIVDLLNTGTENKSYKEGLIDGQAQVINITMGYLQKKDWSEEEIIKYTHYVGDELGKYVGNELEK